MKKLVVSRKIDFSMKLMFLKPIQNLIKTYTTAFRYLFFHPKVGMWIGATPEQLLKIEYNHFETVALAGTSNCFQKMIHWDNKRNSRTTICD